MKRKGKGSYVRSDVHEEGVFSNGSFTDACLRMGSSPSTKVVSARVAEAPEEVSQRLGHEGAQLVTLLRVRSVDGEPCILETDYFPREFGFLLDEPLDNKSLLSTIQRRAGVFATTFDDRFRVAFPTSDEAVLLCTRMGTPLLEVMQEVSDGSGDLVYVNRQLITTNRYVYAVRSRKTRVG